MRALLALPVLVAALGTAVGAAARGTVCRWTVMLDRPGPQLVAVAAISDRNVWAVGSTADHGVILHWDGHGWWPSVSPVFPIDVAASSPRDVWIVGTSGTAVTHAQSEHWNGSSWTLRPVPGGPGSYLAGLTTPSSGAWAVGADARGPLVVRWTGRAWLAVRTTPSDGILRSIDRGWAVGTVGVSKPRGFEDPLVEHLVRGRLEIAKTPSVDSVDENLLDVDAVAAGDVWAVGTENVLGRSSPLVQRLQSGVWLDEAVNGLPQTKTSLLGVAAFGANDVWVAGYQGISPQRTVIAHWDGAHWTQSLSRAGQLADLSALSRHDIWAVGGSTGRSLIQHYACSS